MDVVNRVTTVVRADTSQAEAATRRLRGVERDRAKALVDDLNSQNDRLDKQIAFLGKLGMAVGAGVALYKVGQAAAKAYLEDVRLESAAAGANIDRLRESTKGLVETDALLAFAGKAQHGVWKLNQEEMETVLQGANALRIKMGTELQPTVEKLTEAVAKGSTRALKEFGIEATSKGEAINKLKGVIKSLRGETSLTGDDFQRAGVKWRDALDDLQGQFGKLVLQLTPMVTAFAELAATLAKVAGVVNDTPWMRDIIVNSLGGGFVGYYRMLKTTFGPGLTARSVESPTPEEAAAAEAAKVGSISWEQRVRQMQALRGPDPFTALKPVPRASDPKRKAATPEELLGFSPDVHEFVANTAEAVLAAAQALIDASLEDARPGDLAIAGKTINRRLTGWRPLDEEVTESQKFLEGFKGLSRGADDAAAAAVAAGQAAQARQRMSFCESVFGPSDQFNLYARGFDMLTGAASAAFDAWITGGQSLGAAVKKFIGEFVRASALQMAVEAIKETALGFAALAWGPMGGPSAGAHFKAAAMFAGGAALAGGTAKLLGAGQSGASTPSAPTAGSALAGGTRANANPTQPGGGEVVIMIGRDFLGLTDLEQRQLVSRAIEMGLKSGTRTSNIRNS